MPLNKGTKPNTNTNITNMNTNTNITNTNIKITI